MTIDTKATINKLCQVLYRVTHCQDCGGRGWIPVAISEDDYGEDPCECYIEADQLLDRLVKEGVIDKVVIKEIGEVIPL